MRWMHSLIWRKSKSSLEASNLCSNDKSLNVMQEEIPHSMKQNNNKYSHVKATRTITTRNEASPTLPTTARRFYYLALIKTRMPKFTRFSTLTLFEQTCAKNEQIHHVLREICTELVQGMLIYFAIGCVLTLIALFVAYNEFTKYTTVLGD